MTLSLVIPNYNKCTYMKECLDSVFKQTLQPDEIVVVDDSSTDDSVRILHKIQEQYPTLVVVPLDENGGVSNARNVGVRTAKSDYISFLDSDDYYYNERKLENEMALISEFGDSTIAYSYTAKVDEFGNLIRKRMGSFRYPEGKALTRLIANYRYCSGMPRDYCLSKKLFLETGGYTAGKNLYEDMELTIKLCKKGGILQNTKQIGTAYRSVSTGLSRQKEECLREELYHLLHSFYIEERWIVRREIDILKILTFVYRGIESIKRRFGIDPEGR